MGFLADDRLVKKHVVQHAPEGIAGGRATLGLACNRVFHCFTYCNAETPWGIGVLRKNFAASLGFRCWGWEYT